MSQAGTLRLDISYVTQLPGALHVAEIGTTVICMICLGAACQLSMAGVIWFTLLSSFFISLIMLAVNLFHLKDLTNRIPWNMIDIARTVFYGFFSFVSFVASAVAAGKGCTHSAWVANTLFLVVLIALFLGQLYYAIQQRRSGLTSPAYMDEPAPAAYAATGGLP